MSDATAVSERTAKSTLRRKRKLRRIRMTVVACLAAVALTVCATFSVFFYLNLQEERRLSAKQGAQISSLQQQLSAQNEQLAQQQSQIDKNTETISNQYLLITQQDDIITSQQELINSLRPAVIVDGVGSYPAVDITDLQDKKLVALTFDDGPGPQTERLLDALKYAGARATFFLLGERINSTTAPLIERMEAEGHAVGNHSQNHKNLRNLSASGVRSEMGAAAKKIKKIIGHDPYVMRCPGGNYNSTVKSYAKSITTPIIQWDVDTLDWKYRNKNYILNKAKSEVKEGSIVLMHDLYKTTVDAAIDLVAYLKSEGYTLVTVPELLAVKHGTIQPGKVYYHGHQD